MRSPSVPIEQDLVLLGGGHSHAIMLRMWGMNPLPGVRLTLISDGSDTPYSGMLPGYVAGFYDRADCHIDLRSLCQFTGAQFYHDRAVGLDLAHQRVICADRQPVRFDWLSIDIGSTPKQTGIPKNAIAAKPVPQFLQWWEAFCEEIMRSGDSKRLSIIGGGVGGVELALNMQAKLPQVELHLFSRSAGLLTQHNPQVQRYFQQLLPDRGIQLHLNQAVQDWDGAEIITESGDRIPSDAVVWVTEATAPPWIAASGLAVDQHGFIQVNQTLQSISHPQVFAAGDIANMVNSPRPKAGVFAVRQGQPLFENLQRSILRKPLQNYHPQTQYLSLIGTADGQAVASRGPFFAKSALLWQWKDRIDRDFMRRFQDLPEMASRPLAPNSGGTGVGASQAFCTGCAAKVGSDILSQTLTRIREETEYGSLLETLDRPDDAAILEIPAGKKLIQTVDYFPSLIDDPYIFGQIATHHSLSDLFAMGATPHSVLAIAAIPQGNETIQSETLFQLLCGALKALSESQTQLVGGHTLSSEQLMFGLSCNGFADDRQLLHKGGIQVSDGLILTQAIGIGTLFAATMQGQAKPQWIDQAIAVMLRSNYQAAQILQKYGATACTDVTGFGLMGHLVEMVKASNRPLAPNSGGTGVRSEIKAPSSEATALGGFPDLKQVARGLGAILQLNQIPILPGAQITTDRGVRSTLYAQNQRSQQSIANLAQISQHSLFPLLFDPQTAGGLLASVPAEAITPCLEALHTNGYSDAACIGHILPQLAKGTLPITIEA
jgi:selenide, water dikinase